MSKLPRTLVPAADAAPIEAPVADPTEAPVAAADPAPVADPIETGLTGPEGLPIVLLPDAEAPAGDPAPDAPTGDEAPVADPAPTAPVVTVADAQGGLRALLDGTGDAAHVADLFTSATVTARGRHDWDAARAALGTAVLAIQGELFADPSAMLPEHQPATFARVQLVTAAATDIGAEITRRADAPRPAAARASVPSDPIQARAEHVARLVRAAAVSAMLTTWAAAVSDQLVTAAGGPLTDPTEADAAAWIEAHEFGRATATTWADNAADPIGAAVGRLTTAATRAVSPTAARAPRATSTGTTAPRAAAPTALGPWSVGQVRAHGPSGRTCTCVALDDASRAGQVRGTFQVHNADGSLVGSAVSPSGAALLVNGGSAVSGNAYWSKLVTAPAADDAADTGTEAPTAEADAADTAPEAAAV